jgi:histone H3/H4
MGRDFSFYKEDPKIDQILVVAAKVKKLIKEAGDLNTSAQVMEQLTVRVQKICLDAIKNAVNDKRKTVMDRDFVHPTSSFIGNEIFQILLFHCMGSPYCLFQWMPKTPYTNETLPKDDESVTLFFIPSPFGINWESPKKLLYSMILNYFSYRPHFMGHVSIQVSCTDLANKQHNFITGMSLKH